MIKWILLPTNSQLQPEHIKGFGDQHDGMRRAKWKNKEQTQYQKNITTYSLVIATTPSHHRMSNSTIKMMGWLWGSSQGWQKYYGDEDDKHDYSIWTISLKCHILTCTTSCHDLDGGKNIFQLFSLLYTSERTSIRGGLLAEFEYFLIGNPLEPSDGEVVQEYFNIMSSKGSAVWGGWPGGVNRLINIGWLDGWAGPVDSTSTTPLPPLVPGGPHLLELLPAAVIFHPNIFTLDRNNITSATSATHE